MGGGGVTQFDVSCIMIMRIYSPFTSFYIFVVMKVMIQFVYYENLYRFSYRNNHSEVSLGKGVLKICNKFTRKHPCRSAIS